MGRQIIPNRLRHDSGIIQPYFSIDDLTKETGSLARHNRNEIRSGLFIIISLQSNRPAAVFF
jgi:hypothetical protein